MSEFAASMLGNSLPTDAMADTVKSQDQVKMHQSPDGKGFPQLFASLNPEHNTLDSDVQAATMNPFTPLPLVSAVDAPVNSEMMTAGLAEFIGNNLPQNLPAISVSGFVAQGDQNGASAISFIGDDKQVVATTPQTAKSIAPAIEQSQQNLKDGLQQQLQTLQADGQDVSTSVNHKAENAKQLELIADMAKHNDSVKDNLIHKPTTSAAFSHLLSSPIAQHDASASTTSMPRGLEPMTATLQQPQWNNQLGDRIHMMISKGMHQAEIHLNPPELGRLDVKIQVHGDHANVHFSTPHGQVRDALDAALPRLREMFEHNGLTLGDVNVSNQSLAQGQSHSQDSGQGTSGSSPHTGELDSDAADIGSTAKTGIITSGNGLLDVFA
jgi:flagellar hook-length control protein FliK